MADVFVSYARKDKALVAPLVAVLEAEGWSVWWDPAISPGQEFDRRIAQELKLASAIVVVWTPNSVESRWVRGEARDAADRGILVPVRFASAELPIDVRALHTMDLDDWDGHASSPPAQQVLSALEALIGRKAAGRATVASDHSAPRQVSPGRVAICVLPFANMSGDPEQEYFSDGITEDIITDLSKISALAVISRNSAFVFKGKHVDVPKIARELKVSHVLEGSVRKEGNRVRITAQLVDGASNDHLWAERYDRDLNDIFALQDEIAHAIVAALKLKLLPGEKHAITRRGTDNAEAYNLYLMARQYYVTSTEGDAQRAESIIRLCTRAIEIDPGYARAWALLAVSKSLLHYVRGGQQENGLADAEHALTLDPDLAEAHAVKARIHGENGQYEVASAEMDAALRLDPESYEVNRSAAYLRYRHRQPKEAIPYFEKAMTLLDTDLNSANMLTSCYMAVGDTQKAQRTAQFMLAKSEDILTHDPTNAAVTAYMASALSTLGQTGRAKDTMQRALLLDHGNLKMRYNFACNLAANLKDLEAALDLLGPVFEKISMPMLNMTMADPDFDLLRDHPRFKAMVAAAAEKIAAEDKP